MWEKISSLRLFYQTFYHFSKHHFSVNAQRPDSLSLPSAEPRLWTSQCDAEVKLRIGDSGVAAETPLTVNQMFTSAVERFGDYIALSWKEDEQQKSLNYKEYYQACRTAAKSFLKVDTCIWHIYVILMAILPSFLTLSRQNNPVKQYYLQLNQSWERLQITFISVWNMKPFSDKGLVHTRLKQTLGFPKRFTIL